jgi:N-acyl-D-aspartate/D-glutamate deacylase
VIQAISTEPLGGRRPIDASGLIVAPGFIDLYQHARVEISEGLYRMKAIA